MDPSRYIENIFVTPTSTRTVYTRIVIFCGWAGICPGSKTSPFGYHMCTGLPCANAGLNMYNVIDLQGGPLRYTDREKC